METWLAGRFWELEQCLEDRSERNHGVSLQTLVGKFRP